MESNQRGDGEVDSDAQCVSGSDHDAESSESPQDGDDSQARQSLTAAVPNNYSVNGHCEVKYSVVSNNDSDWILDGLMVFGCFSIYVINMSHLNVMSVLFLDLMDMFGTEASTLTALLSVTGLCYCLSSQVIVNAVMPRVSIRSLLVLASCVMSLSTLCIVVFPNLPVFIIISVIKFLAQGGAFVPAVTVVGQSIHRRKTLAVTLSVLGSSVASIVIPPMARFLYDLYGFRGCFLMLSGLEMNAIVASLLVQTRKSSGYNTKPLPNLSTPSLQTPTAPRKTKMWSCWDLLKEVIDVSLLRNYLVILQLVSVSLTNLCLFLPIYLPAHAELTGISQTDAANLRTIVGLCDTSARLIYAFLGNLKWALPSRVIALTTLYMGIVCLFVTLLTSFRSLVFLAVSIGLLGLTSVGFNPNLTVELLGDRQLGKMLALSQLVSIIWASIQYPIHGIIIEATGSFVLSIYFVGVNLILGSLCLVCVPLVRKLQRKREMTVKYLS